MKKYLIRGVKIFKFKPFIDFRGKYIETFNKKEFNKISKINFVQDDISISKKGILRGFHGDSKTWKLFTCLSGKIQFAVINFDSKSKYFKENNCIIVDENSNFQILVPPMFGVAHLVLSKKCILSYKQSTYYGQNKQFTVSYKSKCLNFNWKIKKIITSKRDSNGKILT